MPYVTCGKKGSEKKGTKRVGHKDAVLSLSWNSHLDHIMASGSADQPTLVWDMNTASVAAR